MASAGQGNHPFQTNFARVNKGRRGRGNTALLYRPVTFGNKETAHSVLLNKFYFDHLIFDSSSSASWQGVTNAISWTHTCKGSNRLLVVAVGIRGADNNAAVSSITYNSVALTKLIEVPFNGAQLRLELWYLTNPATSANTVSVTLTANTSGALGGGAISFNGIAQPSLGAYSIGTQETGGGVSITTNITTGSDNSWILDAVLHRNDTDILEGTQQTNRIETNNGSTLLALSTKPKAKAGGTSMSWSAGADHSWRHILAEIQLNPDLSPPSIIYEMHGR